jgi:hypothetical protein
MITLARTWLVRTLIPKVSHLDVAELGDMEENLGPV